MVVLFAFVMVDVDQTDNDGLLWWLSSNRLCPNSFFPLLLHQKFSIISVFPVSYNLHNPFLNGFYNTIKILIRLYKIVFAKHKIFTNNQIIFIIRKSYSLSKRALNDLTKVILKLHMLDSPKLYLLTIIVLELSLKRQNQGCNSTLLIQLDLNGKQSQIC